jgi:hypothetical protein
MQTQSHNNDTRKYITILADGKFHQTVEDGTPGSVVREYEDKERNMKQKIELVHDSVTGKITKVSFEDGEYGKSLQIELDNEGIISAGTTSNFGVDLMKKLPAIDLSKEVKLAPYSFNDDKDKNRKGVTVYQDGEKVESFYWDSENKKSINGLPEPEGDTKGFDADDWKMHFMVVRKFLVKEIDALALKHFFEPTSEVEAQTTDEVSFKDF